MLSSVLAELARRILGRGPRTDIPAATAGSHSAAAAHTDAQTADELGKDLLRLGIEAAQAGRYAEAHSLLQRAAGASARDADVLEALANVEQLLGRFESAETQYRRALAIDAGSASRWANLGLCLRTAGRLQAAAAALDRSLELDPAQPISRLNRALVEIDRGNFAAGEQQLRALLTAAPQFAEAHTALAHVLLLHGRYAEGWQEYEWRLRLPDAVTRAALPLPYWDGTHAGDKSLLVTAEQGLGDQLMLLSCIPEVARQVRQCWLECDARLAPLVLRSFANVRVLPYRRQQDAHWLARVGQPDLQIPLGSLPGLLRPAAERFPQHAGYLRADPARVAAWRARLDALGDGPKIGLSWRGGAATTRAALRSMPLRALQPIVAANAGVFVSLQYGDCTAELATADAILGGTLWHFADAIADYTETAALVCALDRIVTVQTAVAHLAGALGKDVWIMLPVTPEWRYGAGSERMCWYPSARLFRQARLGDWDGVIRRVADALHADLAEGTRSGPSSIVRPPSC